MKPISVTQDELLSELMRATNRDNAPPEAMTAAEMRAKTGLRRTALKDRLDRLNAEGRLETWRTYRTDVRGQRQLVPAYTIKPAGKPTKQAK